MEQTDTSNDITTTPQRQRSALVRFFTTDRSIVGFIVVLGSELGFALVLALVLLIIGIHPANHIRWFAGMFIPPVLALRHYAHKKALLKVTRAIIIGLFITFIAFMIYLFKSHTIVLR